MPLHFSGTATVNPRFIQNGKFDRYDRAQAALDLHQAEINQLPDTIHLTYTGALESQNLRDPDSNRFSDQLVIRNDSLPGGWETTITSRDETEADFLNRGIQLTAQLSQLLDSGFSYLDRNSLLRACNVASYAPVALQFKESCEKHRALLEKLPQPVQVQFEHPSWVTVTLPLPNGDTFQSGLPLDTKDPESAREAAEFAQGLVERLNPDLLPENALKHIQEILKPN